MINDCSAKTVGLATENAHGEVSIEFGNRYRRRAQGRARKLALELVFDDPGPGIADIEQAMQEGYTSSGGLGMGLPGTKRLMDEMEICSKPGKGTTVTVRKWRSKLSRFHMRRLCGQDRGSKNGC